ncbi:MAG TPA: GGDEF domain-containing protein [Gammaproteobacteria bacterium]|nr:GGDEF domain-containing protein [Gammaproteobacteria bacterium]
MNPTDFSSTFKTSKTQKLRVKIGCYALLGATIHTCICLLIWIDGFLHASGIEFISMFSVIWAGYLAYFILLKTGFNQSFKDPDLIMPIIVWAVTSVMYTVSLTVEIRSLLLMFNLLVLVFAAFNLNRRQYILVTLYGIVLYIGIIVYLKIFHPLKIDIKEEGAVFLGYVLLTSALSAICYKISKLRKHLHQKNQKLAIAIKRIGAISMTDELTKIKNRRYILDILRRQVLMVARGQYFFSVCMLDIDHFKQINDVYGHLAGDSALKMLCQKVLTGLREIDYFARIGGEEFLFVLPLVDKEQAKYMADRIRVQIENTNFDEVAPGLKMTISLGVSDYQSPEKIETTLARIDSALYAAKRTGRNQVIVQ